MCDDFYWQRPTKSSETKLNKHVSRHYDQRSKLKNRNVKHESREQLVADNDELEEYVCQLS